MKQWMRTLLAGMMAVFFAAAMPVTAAAEELRFPEPVESNVFTAPALVTAVDTQAELDALSVTLPDTAVFSVSDAGEVVLADGTVVGTVAETAALCGTVIPAFEVSSEAAVQAAVNGLKDADIKDYFVISDDPAILRTAIDLSIWSRTVLRVTDRYKTEDGYDLMKIRGDANAAGCHVVILPEEISDRYHADYLQRRLIGVWTVAPDAEHGNMAAILSGGNGILTEDIAGAKAALAGNFDANTMTRAVLIVGHRGMPGTYPENTLEGSLYAIEAGADIVENDIYITRDGVIVAMHDGDISRTTNGAGNVEDFTLEELKAFEVDTHPAYSGWKIPTLEEYFIEWKKLGKDKQLFVEIKSGKSELIDEFVRLVKEYDIADQVSVITFSQDQILRLREAFPEMSVGFLTSGVVNDDFPTVFKNILRSVQKLETTYNHNLDGITADYVRQLNIHGITHWPWTYRDSSQFIQHFLTGINGMTTDYSNWIGETVKYCCVGEGLADTSLTIEEGETLENVFRTVKYNGNEAPGGEIRIVSGGESLTADGNTITGTAAGEAYIYANYKSSIITKPMRATSGLIKVTVLPKSEEAAAVEEPATEEPPEMTAEPAETAAETVTAEVLEPEKGIAVVPAAIGIGIAAVIGVVGILLWKRR